MSKKYSPTSISSKLTKSKKELPGSQQNKSQKSKSSHKSSDKQSRRSSNSQSNLSQGNMQLTHQKVMQQAIQKASCLIQLLTRQNSQSKLYIDDLLEQLSDLKSKHQQHETLNHQLLQELALSENQTKTLCKQNQDLLFQLEKIKLHQNDQNSTNQKLQQTKTKNKKLHEKIAFMTKNFIQINKDYQQLDKEFQQLKKQYKSLQNQNKYLVQQLKKSSSKQNIFHQNLSHKQNQFDRKLKDLQTTKQAFATRTHELKQQNMDLIMEMQLLRKEKYDLQIISRESIQTLDAVTKKIESYRYIEEKVHRIYEKIKFVMEQAISQPFLRTQLTSKQKLDQIQMLVTYRVQHIENLMKKICDRVQKPDWKCNLRELNQAKILAQRLSTYLGQLSTKPLLQF